MRIINEDCVDAMRGLSNSSIDSIVTDPPYGLGFMGKKWDVGTPAVDVFHECLRVLKPGGHLLAFGGSRTYHRLAVAIEDAGFEIRDQIMWLYGSGFPKSRNVGREVEGFEGWGTALKPAHEPIVLARKPLEGTVANNVLKWGTGAVNVDGCRVPTNDKLGGGMVSKGRPKSSAGWDRPWMHDHEVTERKKVESAKKVAYAEDKGRFPANLIHDGSDEATADMGSASRYFYCAKASKKDRGEGNNHPTVKPHDLMRYLVRLVTPPGGTVLDPFMGSGSTGFACKAEGFDFVGIEIDSGYCEIAAERLHREGM